MAEDSLTPRRAIRHDVRSVNRGRAFVTPAAVGATQGVNIDKVTARKMVLVGTFAMLAINIYRSRRAEGEAQTYKRLWTTGFVGLMLSILADFAPQVAGPFSVLVVLGSLTKHGDEVFSNALSGSFALTGGARSPDNRGGPRGPGGTVPKPKPKPKPKPGGAEAPGMTR